MSGIAQMESSFLRQVALPTLLAAQNSDGGWGFFAGSKSAVEPTSWSLLAISGTHANHSRARRECWAARFLKGAQLPEGSWPAVVGQEEGGWVTSIACMALRASVGASPETGRALAWICREWPGEGGLWWRIQRRLSSEMRRAQPSDRLRGWSWTRGTSSWVEPTSHALLALRGASLSSASLRRARHRRELAQKMLCDRTCPGGGWNCGNTGVYGAAGKPLIGPTAWALLALGEFADRPSVQQCVRQGLDWLERASDGIRGPGSLVLAHLCLRAFGRTTGSLDSQLFARYVEGRHRWQIPELAWITLALRPSPDWLRPQIFESL